MAGSIPTWATAMQWDQNRAHPLSISIGLGCTLPLCAPTPLPLHVQIRSGLLWPVHPCSLPPSSFTPICLDHGCSTPHPSHASGSGPGCSLYPSPCVQIGTGLLPTPLPLYVWIGATPQHAPLPPHALGLGLACPLPCATGSVLIHPPTPRYIHIRAGMFPAPLGSQIGVGLLPLM